MGNKKKFNASENVQQWSVKPYLWATNNIIATQNSSGSTSTWDWKEADRAFTNVCVCVNVWPRWRNKVRQTRLKGGKEGVLRGERKWNRKCGGGGGGGGGGGWCQSPRVPFPSPRSSLRSFLISSPVLSLFLCVFFFPWFLTHGLLLHPPPFIKRIIPSSSSSSSSSSQPRSYFLLTGGRRYKTLKTCWHESVAGKHSVQFRNIKKQKKKKERNTGTSGNIVSRPSVDR